MKVFNDNPETDFELWTFMTIKKKPAIWINPDRVKKNEKSPEENNI